MTATNHHHHEKDNFAPLALPVRGAFFGSNGHRFLLLARILWRRLFDHRSLLGLCRHGGGLRHCFFVSNQNHHKMKIKQEFESIEITNEEKQILLQLLYLEIKRIEAQPSPNPEQLVRHIELLNKLTHVEEVIIRKIEIE